MAFIKIDTDGMLTVINNLNEHADGIETERKNVNDSSAANHDPVPSVEMVTRPTPFPSFMDPSTASGTLSACSQALYSLAEELRTRRQEAIDLNSNGITTNPDSTIVSYYLPDPPEGTADVEAYWDSTDTVDNVRAYNSQSVANAEEESAELDEALKTGTGNPQKGAHMMRSSTRSLSIKTFQPMPLRLSHPWESASIWTSSRPSGPATRAIRPSRE